MQSRCSSKLSSEVVDSLRTFWWLQKFQKISKIYDESTMIGLASFDTISVKQLQPESKLQNQKDTKFRTFDALTHKIHLQCQLDWIETWKDINSCLKGIA
jgi:hypothetical protein